MSNAESLDAIRRHAVLASLAGFPFLFVMGVAWILAAVLCPLLPATVAPWVYPMAGGIAIPIAIALERRWAYLPAPEPDPLLPLALQLLFVQIVAFPAILLVWDTSPHYTPVAFAAVVGAHFLPFEWLYQTSVYRALSITVALGPFLLALVVGRQAMVLTGYLVGLLMLVGALLVRRHAATVWANHGSEYRAQSNARA